MKKISIIVALLVVLMSLPIISSAHSSSVIYVDFTDSSTFSDWKTGKYGTTAVTEDNRTTASKYLRGGVYAAKKQDFHVNSPTYIRYSKSTPINGMAYVYAWVYYTDVNGMPTSDIQIKTSLQFSSAVYSTKTLSPGWNLVEWEIASKYRNGTLDIVSFYNDNANFSGDNYKTAILYISSIFLTDSAATQPSVTSSSVKDGATLVKHNLGKITLSGTGFAPTLLEGGKAEFEPSVANHVEFEGNDLVIVLDEEMQFGTDYSLTVTGAMDKNGMEYLPYGISFRTRGENENIPPAVELLSPEGGTRFMPGDTITLSAKATDEEGGTISYVEFFANGELIQGSRVTEGADDIYNFQWTTDIDSLEATEITALACDNNDAKIVSDKVLVTIASFREPIVELTSPTEGSVYYRNLAGVITDTALELAFTASDEDNEICAIDFLVDGETVYTETEDISITSFKLPDALENGEHSLSVVAYDESGLSSEASVSVTVKTGGKRFPGLLEEDLTDSAMFAKWDKTGNASFYYGTLANYNHLSGIILHGNKPAVVEESSLSRIYVSALDKDSWQVDVSLAFGDTLSDRVVKLGTTEVMTFAAGGNVNYGGTVIGKYVPGSIYTVSAVIDTVNSKITCFLDGEAVADPKSVTISDFQGGATITVTQNTAKNAESETALTYAGIYRMADTARSVSVTLYDTDGNEITNLASVPVSLGEIEVTMDGETNTDTLLGNVYLKNVSSGEHLPVDYVNGRLITNSILKNNCEYRIIVNSSVQNKKGKAYSGAYSVSFTTESKDFATVNESISFSSGTDTIISLPDTPGEVTLNIPFINQTTENESVVIVLAVYEGVFAKGVVPTNVTIPANTTDPQSFPASIDLAEFITEVTDNTVVEAFVVNNLDDLVPVNDTIIKLK
ncbi:MAG: hypothetical protein E7400_02140 [Ruminococcaceae bacterium]|nr:hypothetical protein [Oscillospiraceae bacterium]